MVEEKAPEMLADDVEINREAEAMRPESQSKDIEAVKKDELLPKLKEAADIFKNKIKKLHEKNKELLVAAKENSIKLKEKAVILTKKISESSSSLYSKIKKLFAKQTSIVVSINADEVITVFSGFVKVGGNLVTIREAKLLDNHESKDDDESKTTYIGFVQVPLSNIRYLYKIDS